MAAAGIQVPPNPTREQVQKLVATTVSVLPNEDVVFDADFVSVDGDKDDYHGMEESDEEIAQLEKKKRILQLRKEIDALENTREPTEPRPRIDFTDIQHAIVPFTGDTTYGIRKWIADFDRIMDTAQADMRTRLLFARRLMAGSAALLRITICFDTWPELKCQLIEEFDRKVDRQDVYVQLSQRKIRKDEPIRHYILSMQALATHADIEERELVRFIVDGLDNKTAAVAMLYSARNLVELKNSVADYERYRTRHIRNLR